MDGASKRLPPKDCLPFPLRGFIWCAGAPLQARQALQAASLCHACRLRIRRITIMRNRPGLGETVAPQKWCGVKDNRRALDDGKRARKGDRPMGTCVTCKRNVQQAENWIRCHLWGGF